MPSLWTMDIEINVYKYEVVSTSFNDDIGGRDIKYFCRRYPISDIDIALSDIGKKLSD
jgi:hypothetical protein